MGGRSIWIFASRAFCWSASDMNGTCGTCGPQTTAAGRRQRARAVTALQGWQPHGASRGRSSRRGRRGDWRLALPCNRAGGGAARAWAR